MSTLEIQTSILRAVLESFQKIHTEIILELSDEKILISTRNLSHSVFMKAQINSSLLQKYEVSEYKKWVFDSTNVREFLKIYPEETTQFTITRDAIYIGRERNFLFYVFSEEEFFEMPEMKMIYTCPLEKGIILQTFRELEIFSDFFKMVASNKRLIFSGEDQIKGKGRIILEVPEIEKFEGIFPLQPLLDILDDKEIENEIEFKIFENHVIGISFRKHEIAFSIYIVENIGVGVM